MTNAGMKEKILCIPLNGDDIIAMCVCVVKYIRSPWSLPW